jgi:hypothetical protein
MFGVILGAEIFQQLSWNFVNVHDDRERSDTKHLPSGQEPEGWLLGFPR